MSGTPIPWFTPAFGGEEEAAVAAVVRSGFVNDGSASREFEAAVAEIVGVRHCVAVTSGTAAISLALMALGIGPGDEVIVPDLTFIATANAVRMTGAEAVLVDVEGDRLTLDIDAAERAITPRTRAVLPVDVNGRGADYPRLEALCAGRGLELVSDSAEGLGSHVAGRPLGSFGKAGCFSFSPNKLVTTGQGGIVATNDARVFDRLNELKDQGRPKRGTGGDDLHPSMGYNFKFTDLQAALGLAQLRRLPERIDRARDRDALYRELLRGLNGCVVPGSSREEPGEVRLWMDALFDDKAAMRQAFDGAGIGHRAFWFPLHRQEPYKQADASFATSLSVSERGLWLPSTFAIRDAEIRTVVDCVTRTLQGAGSRA